MKWDDVVELPPWGTASTWNEANRSIRHLINLHHDSLCDAAEIALGIRDKLTALFPMQDELVKATCVTCHSPCCVTATVWLDFCDLILLHLTDQVVPEYQLIERQTDSCRYHSDAGCLIPRLSRPWVCTLYLCPPQMALLRSNVDGVRENIDDTIKSIKLYRKKLEEIFIEKTS